MNTTTRRGKRGEAISVVAGFRAAIRKKLEEKGLEGYDGFAIQKAIEEHLIPGWQRKPRSKPKGKP